MPPRKLLPTVTGKRISSGCLAKFRLSKYEAGSNKIHNHGKSVFELLEEKVSCGYGRFLNFSVVSQKFVKHPLALFCKLETKLEYSFLMFVCQTKKHLTVVVDLVTPATRFYMSNKVARAKGFPYGTCPTNGCQSVGVG